MQRKCIILLAQNVSVVREILSCWNQWLYFYQLLSRVEVGGRVQKRTLSTQELRVLSKGQLICVL